jgi:general stress protein 26
LNTELRKEIESKFRTQGVVYLATVEGDQPRVRPVTLVSLDAGFYVITGARGGRDAAKLQQIRNNPRVEYYLTLEEGENKGFIRGEATASVIPDPVIKERLFSEIQWAKSYFQGPEDLNYVLLGIHPRAYSYRRPGDYEILREELE